MSTPPDAASAVPRVLPQTELLYYVPGHPLRGRAHVVAVGEDARGAFVCLDRTAFHPQGGGQPADQGTMTVCDGPRAVMHVAVHPQDRRVICHYLDLPLPDAGTAVAYEVSADFRRTCARLHSGGHLLADVVEQLAHPARAVKGHHFPDGAYVEFDGCPPDMDLTELRARAQTVMDHRIQAGEGLDVAMSADGLRRVQFAAQAEAVPCGGTHVLSTSEIQQLEIDRVKLKKGRLKISYSMGLNR